ncbi:hypothetical protein GCM10007989_24670 [Devosia pacifica]|uniref:Uncharacterized protein n=1 Tax=Devosia pacifica TaxID=1335967 RepID=A0A918S851_9HYPH|nr:hypothetical protein [Devosia pacifica]GHA27834.1 hypothetical protein GCM10007989_24670 [Devosia pacifica]
MQHRFKAGQILALRSASRQSNRPSGPCEVIFCLPHDKGPILYRVRSSSETVERVVEEVDLSPTDVMKSHVFEAEAAFKIAVVKR